MEVSPNSSSKRKAAAADRDAFTRGGNKRRLAAAEDQERDWTSLHQDITKLIADRLLEEDVAEYIVFRAVCRHWRASTPSPRDPTLTDRRFHPRGWVALCEGTGVRPAVDQAITFFHSSSGKVRRVRLWELHLQRIVGFSYGLVLLLGTVSSDVRVLNPFTRVTVRLPRLVTFFRYMLSKQASLSMESFAWLHAAVCLNNDRPRSSSVLTVVVWFPDIPVVICAKPSYKYWVIIHNNIQFTNTLPFDGRLYGVTSFGRQLVQIYPRGRPTGPVVAEVPKDLGRPFNCTCCYYLVESMGAMYIAVLRKISSEHFNAFTLLKVDDLSRDGVATLTRVPCIGGGDRALFLGKDRCLSVSAKDLPSISANSIYFVMPKVCNPIMVHSLSDGSFERLSSTLCLEHDDDAVTNATSVQPFTLADHLLTYCHHREWTRGLMFHEFYFISDCWFAFQDSEINKLMKLHVPNLSGYIRWLDGMYGNISWLTA